MTGWKLWLTKFFAKHNLPMWKKVYSLMFWLTLRQAMRNYKG